VKEKRGNSMLSISCEAAAMTTSAQAAPRFRIPAAVLDRAEQVTIVVLWAWMAWRVFHSANPLAPLALLSETAVVIFVLIRRPTQAITQRLGDWLLAVTATAAPLLIVAAESNSTVLVKIGVALMLLGNCFQAWAKLVLRRSFGIAAANRGVKVSGPYKFVRHPMYAGYLVVHIGLLALMPAAFNVLIYGIGWWAQILRLQAEERLLGDDPAYRAYAEQVRWRLIPGVF
ncbi:MAG: methyltransferase family protein, partial [Novosphingobium sp.]